MIPPIRYFCDPNETGYGCAARGYLQALQAVGLGPDRVRAVPAITTVTEAFDDDDPAAPFFFGEGFPAGEDRINIVHLNPGMLRQYWTPLESRYNIALCAWETDALPKVEVEGKTVVDDMNRFDEVWAPTAFVKKVFEDSGVTVPIFVLPHPVREEILAIGFKKDRAKNIGFYTIGSWNARKNVECLLRAYWSTGWMITSPVRLTLHLTPPARDPRSVEVHSYLVRDGVNQIRDAVPDPHDLPQFTLSTVPKHFQWMINKLHRPNHIFVTASRGEGACLPAIEAAAMGNVVIGGGGPALDDLFEVAHPLCAKLESRQVPITPMPECKGYELDQNWWEVGSRDLGEVMQCVASDLKEHGPPSAESVERVRHHYSPGRIGKLMLERLEHAAGVVEDSGW
jgi:hypothetical protein